MTEIDHGGIERCATLHLGSCQEAVAAVAITILPNNFAAAPCPPLCSQQSWLSLLSLLFYCSCHCCGCCHHSPPHLPSLPLPFCHPCRCDVVAVFTPRRTCCQCRCHSAIAAVAAIAYALVVLLLLPLLQSRLLPSQLLKRCSKKGL